ncbi:MAG: hypothetical protein QW273_01470 [Candidatus Pacearchaeota archaeon]
MIIKDFYKKLESKRIFKDFKKNNPDSYLFLVLAILSKNEKESDKIYFDFFVPSKKEIVYFEHPFTEVKRTEDNVNLTKEKINLEKLKVDLEDLWEILEKVKKEKEIKKSFDKIVAVLNMNKWVLKCFSESLDYLKFEIDINTKKIDNFSKGDTKDFFRMTK